MRRAGSLLRAGAAAALLAAACAGEPSGPAGPPDPEAVEAAREKAGRGAGRLMETLLVELTSALAKGPPEHAFGVCADKAQQLTRRIVDETGVAVRRTSLRVRNPSNAPDAFERAWLEEATRRHEAGDTLAPHQDVVETSDGGWELRFLKPILVAPLCTQCHGDPETFSPALRNALHRRYPSDRAVGYEPGDFRGVVSARVPVEE